MSLSHDDKALLEAYFNGDNAPDTIKAMEAWLSADPKHPRILAEYGLIDRLIAHEQKQLDTSAIFAALLEAEEAAETSLIVIPEKRRPTKAVIKNEDAGSLSSHDLVAVGGYALRLALTSKPTKRIYAYAAVAAVLLLAFVLFNPWGESENPTDAPFAADNPSEPGSNGPVITIHVATLTAQHNAQWAERASARGSSLRIGSELKPGQTLTLTAGFAEITTVSGAVAILQAPATIELLNNDNALRLHAGKLVGICETESSKGFLVRTPHMDVTDLGTRFGVAIDESGNTLAEVFDGLVAVNTEASLVAIKLASNESLAIDSRGDLIPRERFADDAFVALNASARGIASLTDVRLVSQTLDPSDPASWPDGEQVYVYEELEPYLLDADLPVSIHQPGQYQSFELPEPSSRVAAGTTIRSYIVMVKSKNQDQYSTARGSLRFNGKILGIIANNQDEQGFVRAVTLPTSPLLVNLQQKSRWPDANTSPQRRDTVTIGDDKQTVSVSFNVQGSYDIIRVIVQEPTQQPTGVVP